ncbi:L-glutamate gamma-semialdehyde dehydrogenase [Cohnella yongneupensis]|uniref:L-glutamate gamma-semialdehyde dehydrogenase n=1 Tax=Cohnella yongneupensis TaxID=425006 RepID=A0ABW0R691_9BACL
MMTPFRNEAFTDFSKPDNKAAFEGALQRVESELGLTYPIVIGGKRIVTSRTLASTNPSFFEQLVGNVCQADRELAELAVRTAAETFETWKETSAAARARLLYKAAAIMRRRKHEFSAWLVYEAGKTWPEADADTAEAIDFMEFYGREMERIGGAGALVTIEGEHNELTYIPLGVGIVIPPWNFPLAIMAGMTTASIVTGNTVVLKPASPTPVIAAKFVQLLEEAGLPPGVVNYLPGPGSEIGDYLVEHPLTRFISFTGSREVGLGINEKASKTSPGQKWIKRVIAEMGGKDAIIVDEDGDIELAADAITASAFGYSGQKCSACSRAIVHESKYNEVLARVIEKTKRLTIGNARNLSTAMGPVIDRNAFEKIMAYIEIGRAEGRIAHGGNRGAPQGFFIEPTIIADVDSKARVSQEEIFGPVVSFTKASSFEEALAFANDTDYGLTGAVISSNRDHLELARKAFHVGNLYFNRKCTGALVGVHPFGGFNMSGTDSKAGGHDYLLLFTQAKIVSERM